VLDFARGRLIVFTEESNPRNYLNPIASGDVDETMLEALEDYVKRQKKRLGASSAQVPLMITNAQKHSYARRVTTMRQSVT
jgi:hypothetical protein